MQNGIHNAVIGQRKATTGIHRKKEKKVKVTRMMVDIGYVSKMERKEGLILQVISFSLSGNFNLFIVMRFTEGKLTVKAVKS